MQLTTELNELAVTKLNVIRTTMPPDYIVNYSAKRARKSIFRVCVGGKRLQTENSSELPLKEQTFCPLVGSNMTSTGWNTGSNILHQRTVEYRGEPGVGEHVPVSRVSVCLCDCFNIGFLSVVARCSPLVVCRHREAWGTLQAMERDPFHPPFHQVRTTWACALLWPLGPAHQG